MVTLQKIGTESPEPAEPTETAPVEAEQVVSEPTTSVEPPAEQVANDPMTPVAPLAEQVASEPTTPVEPPAEQVASEPMTPAPKRRGRPKKEPAPKPAPKPRGRPKSVTFEAPPPQYDIAHYNQQLINAMIAHSNASRMQRQARWSSLVRF